MSSSVLALRQMLEERFPDATPLRHRTVPQVATGVLGLDRTFPAGGLPRGVPTTWSPGGGATAVLRASCEAIARRGERAAWVATASAPIGGEWSPEVWVLRPPSADEALACTAELLRSGGFALVVLADAAPSETDGVRLGRAAREGDSAFVALMPRLGSATLRVESRIEGYQWLPDPFGDPAEARAAAVRVRATALGWSRETRIPLGVLSFGVRLSLDPAASDRRGA